jgi:type IV pilus assembly protein PilB
MELRNAAIAKGYQSLAHEGLLRVIEGITSLTEAARSVDLTGRYG